MKTGRNAPCPCGSGKKYKKCCLRKKEQQAVQEKQQIKADEHSSASEQHIPQKDIQNQALDKIKPINQLIDSADDFEEDNEKDWDFERSKQFWNAYKEKSFDQKVSIIEEILDDPNEIKHYDTYDLIESLYSACESSDEYFVLKRIVHRIKQEYHKIYEKDCSYLLNFLAKLALAEENKSEAIALTTEIAENPNLDMDIFSSRIDHLSYYYDLDTLLNIMHAGWENVKNAEKIMQFAIEDYAWKSADFEILKYIQESSHPEPDNDILLNKLNTFIETDLEKLKAYMANVTGKTDHAWTDESFNYKCKLRKPPDKKKKGAPQKKPKRVSLDDFSENVYVLSCEFMGYLVNKEGFLFPKARMARIAINEYLISRVEGKMDDDGSLLKKIVTPKQKRKKVIPFFDHILCPDRITTERFIASFFTIWNVRIIKGIVFYESIPSWLRFIESKGLIENQTIQNTLSSIYDLFDDLKKVINNHSKDNNYIIQQIEKAYL